MLKLIFVLVITGLGWLFVGASGGPDFCARPAAAGTWTRVVCEGSKNADMFVVVCLGLVGFIVSLRLVCSLFGIGFAKEVK